MKATEQVQKRRVAALYDCAAPQYGEVGPAILAHWGRRLSEVSGVSAGHRVLDVACGRGASLWPSARAVGPQGLVVGVDLSSRMLRLVRRDAAQHLVWRVAVLQMDGEQLAYPNESFDQLLCGFAIFLFPSPQQFLREWQRVLRPGGTIGISVASGQDPRWPWYEECLLRYHDRHHFSLSAGGGGLRNPTDIEEALLAAGIGDVERVTEQYTFTYDTPQQWWAARWTHGAPYPLNQMSSQVLSAFRQEVFDQLEKRMQAEPELRERWTVTFIVGRKL